MTQITDSDREVAEAIVAANIEKWGWGPLDEIEDLSEHKLAVDACAAGIAAMSAEIERLKVERDAAIREMSEWARKAGEAKGLLEGSEAVGVVKGWREKCDQLRREKVEAIGLLQCWTTWFNFERSEPPDTAPDKETRTFLSQQEKEE